jgi:hypothetical protein
MISHYFKRSTSKFNRSIDAKFTSVNIDWFWLKDEEDPEPSKYSSISVGTRSV